MHRWNRSTGRALATSTALVTTLALGLWACSESATSPSLASQAAQNQSVQASMSAAAVVGAAHNAALDHVLADLQAAAAAGQLNSRNLVIIERASLNNYFFSHGYGTISDQAWQQGSAIAVNGPLGRAASINTSEIPVSSAAIPFIKQIMSTVDAPTTAAAVAAAMGTLDAAAKVTLASRDLTIVLSMTSVARSSSLYWEAKRPAWNAVFNSAGITSANAMVSRTQNGAAAERVVNGPAFMGCGWGILGSDVFGVVLGGIIGAGIGSTVAVLYCL